jgi:hypothetical protein
MPTKWRSLVVSDTSRMPAGGPKNAAARVRFVENDVEGGVAGAVD